MLVPAIARLRISRWLESGTFAGPGSRALARAHASFASRALARPLVLPDAAIITVGGATLGGSGKTRVALACVRELARAGASVVLVGHAYGARPTRARVVSPHDALADVGDEALACARALATEPGARVVVGPTRQAAVDLAAALAPRVDAIVIDGPLQLAPVRASLALLAVDAAAPWGAGHLPPAGDLRAPEEALLASADHVVQVDATPRAALLDGRAVSLTSLAASHRDARLGLFTAIGRPDRLERALERAGLRPSVVVRAPDHGPVTASMAGLLRAGRAELWLATEKCALHLEGRDLGLSVAILDGSMVLPPPVAARLQACIPDRVGASPTCVA